jgi:hypothetical protein
MMTELANSSTSLTVPWTTRPEVVAGCRLQFGGGQRPVGRMEFANFAMLPVQARRTKQSKKDMHSAPR